MLCASQNKSAALEVCVVGHEPQEGVTSGFACTFSSIKLTIPYERDRPP